MRRQRIGRFARKNRLQWLAKVTEKKRPSTVLAAEMKADKYEVKWSKSEAAKWWMGNTKLCGKRSFQVQVPPFSVDSFAAEQSRALSCPEIQKSLSKAKLTVWMWKSRESTCYVKEIKSENKSSKSEGHKFVEGHEHFRQLVRMMMMCSGAPNDTFN